MASRDVLLLQQKISDLPFSEDLKNILLFQNLITLHDLLDIETHNWHKNFPGFTYHHQQEIISYLMKNNLEEYIKED